MYAVEFETIINKGFVALPANLPRLQPGMKAKIVILLEDDEEVVPTKNPALFPPTQIRRNYDKPIYQGKPLTLEEMDDAIEYEASLRK